MFANLKVFHRRLLAWYDLYRRDLPWRIGPNQSTLRPDPYLVLVSETMLQQTQVGTVIPYFHRFLAKFPTLLDLTNADLQQVLLQWQGLGYYSRARNLHNAAIHITRQLGGIMPQTVEQLLELPGIGRYTAGAIASIAFEQRAPILDGNVARVLCRLDCVKQDPRLGQIREKLWSRAHSILPRKRLGDFNSALMELGALVCTPKSPRCLTCPVQKHCQAFAAGLQEKIPVAKKIAPTPLERRWTLCIRHRDRYLIEQRPARGRWAGMWQFVTVKPQSADDLAELLHSRFSLRISQPQKIGLIKHALTHRRYQFEIFHAKSLSPLRAPPANTIWTTLPGLNAYPLPRPHTLIAETLNHQKKEAPDVPPGLPVQI